MRCIFELRIGGRSGRPNPPRAGMTRIQSAMTLIFLHYLALDLFIILIVLVINFQVDSRSLSLVRIR